MGKTGVDSWALTTQIMIGAGANLLATDAHGQTVLEYARQCLAEDDADMNEITDDFADASMAETLRQIKDAGIDPDAPIDDRGTTFRQSLKVPRRFKWNSSKNLCQYSAKYWHEEKTWTATRYCYWDWGFGLPGN